MKRYAALLLLAVMIFSLSAFAQNEASSESALALEYSSVEDLVTKGNPNILINKNTLLNYKDSDSLDAAREALFKAAAAARSGQYEIQQYLASGLEPTGSANWLSLNAQMMDISYAVNYFDMQGQSIKTPTNEEIDNVKMRLEVVNDSIIFGAQTLFSTYNTYSLSLSDLQNALKILDRNLEAAKLRLKLGQVTELDVLALESQRLDLKDKIYNVTAAMDSIKSELNLMLGRAFDAPLAIKPMPKPDASFISGIDKAADLKLATEQNLAIRLKKIDLIDKYDDDDLKNHISVRRSKESDLIALAADEAALKAGYEKLYRAMNDKARLLTSEKDRLTLEEKKLGAAQRKFDLGTISNLDLETAKVALETQKNKMTAAESELFGAIQKYKWLLRGVSVEASSAAAQTNSNS